MYVETYSWVTRLREIPLLGLPILRGIQWACGKVSGHAAARGEWGYDLLSGQADSWCRYCGRHSSITLDQLDEQCPTARSVIYYFDGQDIRNRR